MRLLLLALCIGFSFVAKGQGTTSSDMRGLVTGPDGAPLIGANVVATHMPSGTVYGTATNLDGYYQIPGMKVGGPYTVQVTYTGYSESSVENVILRLGETFRKNFALNEANVQLDIVTVVATAGVTGQTAGTSTQISAEQINNVPSLNRDLDDYLRLSPQARPYSDGISFAGVNNRYNAIYIDGAVNNEVYGLAGSGTNGGSTGISPFSMDIIDQFQVVLSPYDVSLGGFAGGGINAVTKSGTNKLSGTAYYFLQNESLVGKTNGAYAERFNIPDSARTRLADFSKKIYGASLGGALKKDKLFFFTNVEIQDDVTPIPVDLSEYTETQGRASEAQLLQLRQHLITRYGYDPGEFGSTTDELKGLKLFGKLDYNLNDVHRLSLRHQYTKAEQYDRFGTTSNTVNFSNNGVFFPSTTNSSALELQSRFSNTSSNELILGFTTVKDDRDAIGTDFPYIFINDQSSGVIRIGTEEFSTANILDQTTFSLTNNFKLYKGNHTFTIGTHNEFYSFNNLFIGQNYGTYRFDSIEAFLVDTIPVAFEYDRSYSLVDELSGDASKAAADFSAMQIGFYVQDQWSVTPRFTLTGGVRLDIPVITTDPAEDTYFNTTALPKMQAVYPIANDVVAGKSPDGQLMISPRIGFELDINGNRNTILRGGAGIFTSRIPFVWPGAMFTNNGLTIGRVDESNLGGKVPFESDINNQYTHPNFAIPSGQVDLFTKDFKYPQVFRTNLALDQKFGNGFEFSLEGLFTKTLNNVLYTNINDDPTVKFNWTGSPDNRAVYNRKNLDNTYGGSVYLASNTNEGYGYNVSATLSKTFSKSFNVYAAYSYGDSYALSEGTSSQNSSQWRGQIHINGRNHGEYGRSDFAAGHRVITSLNFNQEWKRGMKTTVSLLYNGFSGEAISYVIGGNSGRNLNNETGSTSANRSLVWVPASANEINLVDYNVTSGGQTVTVTAAEQWTKLNAFIEADKGLSESRGGYAEKNGSWAPFTSFFDLVVRQDVGADLGGDLHRVQFSLDILNLANLLNKDWGVSYSTPGNFNNFFLYQFEGYDPVEVSKPRFTYRLPDRTGKDAFDINQVSSRWRMRLGVRYLFN